MSDHSQDDFRPAVARTGIAVGLVIGFMHFYLSALSADQATLYFRGLISVVIVIMIVSALTWLARLLFVGRYIPDMEPTLSARSRVAAAFLSAVNFGLFCVSLPLLCLLIAGLVFGWDIAVVGRAFLWILLTVAPLGALRGAVLNAALIGGRHSRADPTSANI